MHYLVHRLIPIAYYVGAGLFIPVTTLSADVTYEGSAGVKAQIFDPTGCESCHDGSNAAIPTLDNYTDAADEIDDIIVRINLPPGSAQLMPKDGTKLEQGLLDLMDGWNASGVPQWSTPQLSVSGHSMLSAQSVDLQGTLNENGRETDAFFKYWSGNTEPADCPSSNSLFSGCTPITSPAGSGGDDIAQTITETASGLNCATSYSFRALSNQNGQFGQQSSAATMNFTTLVGVDSDLDTICDTGDNCPNDANLDQLDTDGDSLGNVCDLDDDGDTINDSVDNCPLDPNPGQEDADMNGIGDVCETDEAFFCFPISAGESKITLICL